MCYHQVRKILDLVQSKGEEVSEFFLYVLQQLADAYVDLGPWLLQIGFAPSKLIQSKAVVNTDPGMRQPQGACRHQADKTLGCANAAVCRHNRA